MLGAILEAVFLCIVVVLALLIAIGPFVVMIPYAAHVIFNKAETSARIGIIVVILSWSVFSICLINGVCGPIYAGLKNWYQRPVVIKDSNPQRGQSQGLTQEERRKIIEEEQLRQSVRSGEYACIQNCLESLRLRSELSEAMKQDVCRHKCR